MDEKKFRQNAKLVKLYAYEYQGKKYVIAYKEIFKQNGSLIRSYQRRLSEKKHISVYPDSHLKSSRFFYEDTTIMMAANETCGLMQASRDDYVIKCIAGSLLVAVGDPHPEMHMGSIKPTLLHSMKKKILSPDCKRFTTVKKNSYFILLTQTMCIFKFESVFGNSLFIELVREQLKQNNENVTAVSEFPASSYNEVSSAAENSQAQQNKETQFPDLYYYNLQVCAVDFSFNYCYHNCVKINFTFT